MSQAAQLPSSSWSVPENERVGLVGKAALLVRVLQRYVHAVQRGSPRQSSHGEAAASGPEDIDLKRELEETAHTPPRVLIILEPGTDGARSGSASKVVAIA